MTVKALDLLRDIEKTGNGRLLLDLLVEARLFRDGLMQRRRVGGVVGHQLTDAVDHAVGHLQHTTDVAQCGARLQRTEGDDLGDLVAAILTLHVADHLFAAILAEVDIEVGHRHAFRVQEALEQEREPQGIDVGDRQCIGHKRARTGTTARADGDVMFLGPFDEVRHDEEVTRKLHPLDDR